LSPPPPIPALFPYTTLFRSRSDLELVAVLELAPPVDAVTAHERSVAAAGVLDPSDGAVEDDLRVQARHAILAEPDLYVGSAADGDRKSTRLNSSHVKISYAV